MKRFIEVLALVFCLLFAGLVVAQQQPAVRIFQQTASDDGSWQKYMSMQDRADIESGFLPIHKLAEQAYATAVNRNFLELVPEDLRSAAVYQAMVILFNNLGNRDKISFAELRERGRTTGVYLPDMRMFLKETGEGFEEFKIAVAKSVKEIDGMQTVPASILGVLSYLKIKDTSYLSLVSQNFREQSGSIAAFTSYNVLPATVILEEFKTLGQGDGLWVPVELEYVKAFAKEFADRTATAVRQETLLKNTSEANLGIQALQTELAKLKREKTESHASGVKIIDLEKKLQNLSIQLESLSKLQFESSVEQNKAIEISNRTLTLVEGMMKENGLIESRANKATDEKITAVYSDIENMVNVIEYNQIVMVVSLSLAIISVLGLVFWVRGRDKRSVKQSMVMASERMDSLQGQILGVNYDRPAVSKQVIAQLKIGEEIVLPISVGHESYEVKVTRSTKGDIIVDGIRHHANDKKNCHEYGIGTNIPTMIDRAANQGHLTHLVVLENVKVA